MPHEQAGGGAAARGNEALRAAAGAVKSDKRRGNIRDIRHKIKERAELPVCAMRHAPGALILAHRERWRRAPHFQGNTPDLAHRERWRRAPHFKVNPPSFHRKRGSLFIHRRKAKKRQTARQNAPFAVFLFNSIPYRLYEQRCHAAPSVLG